MSKCYCYRSPANMSFSKGELYLFSFREDGITVLDHLRNRVHFSEKDFFSFFRAY